jgi:hypothetical protein
MMNTLAIIGVVLVVVYAAFWIGYVIDTRGVSLELLLFALFLILFMVGASHVLGLTP